MFKSLIAIFLSVVFCVCTVGCAASAPVPNPNSTAEVEMVQQETTADTLNSRDSSETAKKTNKKNTAIALTLSIIMAAGFLVGTMFLMVNTLSFRD